MADLTPSKEQLLQAARKLSLQKCKEDGWRWVTNFVMTRDEADQDSIKAFPNKPYLEALWKVIDQNQRVVVGKSRQLMVSWLLSAYCVWFARFHDHKLILWQTQKYEDACAMVAMAGTEKDAGYAARMQFIVNHLPDWMRGEWKPSEGELICKTSGSAILAIAGGANQVRGKTASLIVEDEFAFQPEQAGVYQAVAPLIQKSTKFIAVSTPNGRTNTFSDLYHGVSQGA
jgi:hypothetical protein